MALKNSLNMLYQGGQPMSDFQLDSVLEGPIVAHNDEEGDVVINQPKDFEMTEDH